MKFVIDAPKQVVVPVVGSNDLFPVRRVYCVGKNYAAHVVEMGGTPDRQPPCFFMKPTDAVCLTEEVSYPPRTENYHYEGELVIAIGEGGSNIPRESALSHVYGYAMGIDMTRRDLQLNASKAGNPWDTGKGFDQSAPLSPITPVEQCGHFSEGALSLSVNDDLRQSANFKELIWKNDEIIAELSSFYSLQPGDLIFTGTPAGVGPLERGDQLELQIEGLGKLALKVV